MERHPDGAWVVELAALSDPGLVPQAIASALGITEQAGSNSRETLAESLRDKRLLLILDNCEHLVSAVAPLATTLLRACPHLHLLITSRAPLGIAGELTYRVPSLSLPDQRQAQAVTLAAVGLFEAVRSFIERAQFVRPDFAATHANASVLAQLCYRLDGIPLAIELAAARVRSLAVQQIKDKLDARFRLLTGGDKSALPRHQTLQALVDWSYDYLTENEKTLLGHLSVSAGGWSLEAAEAICGFDPLDEWDILDLLKSLVDKSLVITEEDGDRVRYRLLETLRQYGVEKRLAQGDTDDCARRHRDYYLSLDETAEEKLSGPEQVPWLGRLEREHDNLRAALSIPPENPDDTRRL